MDIHINIFETSESEFCIYLVRTLTVESQHLLLEGSLIVAHEWLDIVLVNVEWDWFSPLPEEEAKWDKSIALHQQVEDTHVLGVLEAQLIQKWKSIRDI